MTLEPDVNQLRTFVSTIFKHAGTEGYVAIRAFYEGDDRPFRSSPTALIGGLEFIVEVAEDDARRAAQAPQPVVFCPPLAVFNNKDHAREEDLSAGLALSTECDTSPQTARQTLEALLGPPTLVVRSGGTWTNGNGESAAKLHLHWVLKEPARAAALLKLKQARMLATALVGGDTTNNPICHPIRWPGSWHRKATPRLCEIETLNPDVEIVLDAALVKLQAAAEAAGISADPTAHTSSTVQASEDELAAAVAVIANPDLDWAAWNNLGMALWRATAGNAAGLALFDQLSQKSTKYDAANTRARWEHYFRSPPARIGAGTIFHLAYTADPDWDDTYYDELVARIMEANAAGEYDELDDTAGNASGQADQDDGHGGKGQQSTTGTAAPDHRVRLALPFINMQDWDTSPLPERQWAVKDRIPLRQPTLFSGEGAVGKSIIELQACVAHVLGRDWLGTTAMQGPAIYMGAEDDQGELRRRLTAIAAHYGTTFNELSAKGLHLLSYAGQDMLLGVPNYGTITETKLFGRLFDAAADIKPKHIGIDTSADVFAGSEIDRVQVRQFVALLRKLAMITDGSVVLLSHPSLTGINTGTGISGSTGWHNSVRARMYLRSPQAAEGEQPDSDLRELQFKKNNYGPVSESIMLRWHDGLFLPEQGTTADQAVRNQQCEESFLAGLRRLQAQGQEPSPHKSVKWAPIMVEQQFPNGTFRKRDYEAAMQRLFAADKIHVETVGPPSKRRALVVPGPGAAAPM